MSVMVDIVCDPLVWCADWGPLLSLCHKVGHCKHLPPHLGDKVRVLPSTFSQLCTILSNEGHTCLNWTLVRLTGLVASARWCG